MQRHPAPITTDAFERRGANSPAGALRMTVLPGPLVEAEWLAAHLGAADLCVLETTVHLDPATREGRPYDIRSGRPEWEAAHIPGSRFADLVEALAEPHPWLSFRFPSPARFAAGMSALGVGDGTRVVVYDRNGTIWATRLWWMLRAFGFDDAAVLDGGWAAWLAAGGEVSGAAPPMPPPAAFTPRPRPELVTDRDDVLASLGSRSTCLLNALASDLHTGERSRYGRPGHIPGSVNVPAAALLHPESGRFLARDALRERLAAAGALDGDRVVSYCGGGIAATLDAFAITLVGGPEVTVYDGSMTEWAADPALPMEPG